MELLKFIFYLGAIVPLITEYFTLSDTKERLAFIMITKKLTKLPKEERVSIMKEYPFLLVSAFAQLLYMIWAIIGMFSFNFPFFIVLFLMGFMPKKSVWYLRLDSILSVALILFMLINTYWLHFKLI